MEFKTDALVLRSADYGENDKMATLLTADRGKIGASLKGVRKAGAKLRFAAQPFCFAEYVLVEKSGRHTVVHASLHDGFFPLREDISRFFAASSVLEFCDKSVLEGMESSSLLLLAVSALKSICEEDPSSALIGFLLEAMRLSGTPVRADKCPVCGKDLWGQGRLRFDLSDGSFGCDACAKGTPASGTTYEEIRSALGGKPIGNRDGQKRALRLLSSYFLYQTESSLASLTEYIRLI